MPIDISLTKNLRRMNLDNRPVELTSLASRFGLTTRPMSLRDNLIPHLVALPLSPVIVSTELIEETPAGYNIFFTINDPGRNTARAADRIDAISFRENPLQPEGVLSNEASHWPRSFNWGFLHGVRYTFRITFLNDVGETVLDTPMYRTAPHVEQPEPIPERPILTVTKEGSGLSSKFIIKGDKFAPDNAVYITVADDALHMDIFPATSDQNGAFEYSLSNICSREGWQGLLHFSAHDERFVPTNIDMTGRLWSNNEKRDCS